MRQLSAAGGSAEPTRQALTDRRFPGSWTTETTTAAGTGGIRGIVNSSRTPSSPVHSSLKTWESRARKATYTAASRLNTEVAPSVGVPCRGGLPCRGIVTAFCRFSAQDDTTHFRRCGPRTTDRELSRKRGLQQMSPNGGQNVRLAQLMCVSTAPGYGGTGDDGAGNGFSWERA